MLDSKGLLKSIGGGTDLCLAKVVGEDGHQFLILRCSIARYVFRRKIPMKLFKNTIIQKKNEVS